MAEETTRTPLDLDRLVKQAEDLETELGIAAEKSSDSETRRRAARAGLLTKVLIVTLQKDEREAARLVRTFVGDSLNSVLGIFGLEIRKKDD